MTKREAYTKFMWLINGSEPCRQEFNEDGTLNDVDLWVGNWTNNAEPEVAQALCAGCHIIDECLTYALDAGEKDFIYGGKTPAERKELLARRQRTKTTGVGFTKDANGTYKAN